jgi:hypothetical protein
MTMLKTTATAALVGIGATVAAPVVIPMLTTAGRPLAKGAIRGVLAISDYVQEFFSEVGERWGDLLAEVRSENGDRPTATAGETIKRSRATQHT